MCESLLGFCLFYNLTVYPYLKTVIIMAKFELNFIDAIEGTERTISAKISNDNDYIIIELKTPEFTDSIFLDKSTSIKFAKTLRTEINKITESEVSNG